jgi:hypothetical protein
MDDVHGLQHEQNDWRRERAVEVDLLHVWGITQRETGSLPQRWTHGLAQIALVEHNQRTAVLFYSRNENAFPFSNKCTTSTNSKQSELLLRTDRRVRQALPPLSSGKLQEPNPSKV